MGLAQRGSRNRNNIGNTETGQPKLVVGVVVDLAQRDGLVPVLPKVLG